MYITAAEEDVELLRQHAAVLDCEWTTGWFEREVNDLELKPDLWALLDPIREACQAVLIVPAAVAVHELLFELGALAMTGIVVHVWHQDDDVPEYLERFFPADRLLFYQDIHRMQTAIWSSMYSSDSDWD